MENKIISAGLQDRASFDQLEGYEIYNDLSDQGQVLWKLIQNYYQKDVYALHVDVELLKQSLKREVPKHYSMFCDILNTFDSVSTPNILAEIIEQKKERNSMELTQALVANKNDDASALWQEREKLLVGDLETNSDNDIVIAPDLAEIFEARKEENRIKVLPESLNKALEGGFLRGHHAVIFAVTDLGKTLFSLNMARGFLEQGYKILYVCNEDPLSDLIERFLVSLTQKDKWTVRRHFDKAQKLAEHKNWHNIIWADLAPGTLGEIRSLIEAHKPDILMVDQMRNIETKDKDSVANLEKVAKAMRNFAKHYNILSISITQAADSAEGKAILRRGDIHNSNVGIPATTDLMLGIGATIDQEFDGVRVLSFAKNKVSGNKQPIQVFFNTKTMRVE